MKQRYATADRLAAADPQHPRRGGRLHPAGPRLPGAAARCRPHARRRTRPGPAGSGGQHHHRAHLQPDDRAQLLDRSEERQRLHADRAVSGEPGADALAICAPFRCAAPAASQPTRLDAVSTHRPHQGADRSGSLPAPPHDRYLRAPAAARIWAGSPTRSTASWHAPRCRTGSTVTLRGMVQGMRASFKSFGLGLMPGGGAALPDPGGAVPIVRRSVPDPAGGAARAGRA